MNLYLVEETRLLDAPGLGLLLVQEGGVATRGVDALLDLLVLALNYLCVLVRYHLLQCVPSTIGKKHDKNSNSSRAVIQTALNAQ